ncbi:MAG: hypothetical protein EXS05_12125 [Planctomycetaceae bacterium]|nr:hypothetical protein [Planctomycetaceae bacterium]
MGRDIHSRRAMGRFRQVLWCALLAATWLGSAIPAFADETGLDDATVDYFRGLRERRLFRLAENYCLQRLSREKLSPALRGDLTLELARTLSEHADYAAEPEQSDLRKQAAAIIGDFLAKSPQHPRRPLLEMQQALISAAAGEWHRWMAELQPYDDAFARQAIAELTDALSKLRTLDKRVGVQVRNASVRRPVADGLTPLEWRALGLHVRQQIGLSLVNLAQVLPNDAPERATTLQEAQKILKSLSDAQEGEHFTWTNRVALIECTRLSGDAAQALKDLQSLAKRDMPPEAADRLLAERVRVLASQKKSADALGLLEERGGPNKPLPGELELLYVQLLVDRGQEIQAPLEVQRQLDKRVERLANDGGGYWSYRSQLVLEQFRDELRYGPELAGLARRAQADFRQGRLSAAAELFGESAAAAHRADRDDLAFQFGFTRASIEIQSKAWQIAADDLQELADQFPDDPKAAEAHLLAAFALGKLYDAEPTESHREDFRRLLEQHRAQYSDPATTGEAIFLLAELDERLGQITAALARYREIPWEHARAGVALVALARCYEKLLDRRRERQESIDTLEREAVVALQRSLPSAADASLALDRHQAEAAMRFARILLRRRPPDYAAADRWLLRVLASLSPPTSGLQSAASSSGATDVMTQALQLRIVSLAGQGKFVEARRQLDQSSRGTPAEALRILEGLAPLTSSNQQDPLHDLGELQLEAALRLAERRETLSAVDQRRFDECLAQGYAAAGQTRRSIEIYESLLEKSPRDKRLLTAFAQLLTNQLLTKSDDPSSRKKAHAAWRKFESLSVAGSDEWLAARYQVCQGLIARGENAEACKLLKVTRLLYPKLGGDALQAKFAELESKCLQK